MTTFPVHTNDSAPEGSKAILADVKNNMGFVPNLIAVMAEAPVAAEAYVSLMDIFDHSSLSDTEQQTVLLSVSLVNECHYCMAAHTTLAATKRVPNEIVEALRTGAPVPDTRLSALANLTRSIVETRGWPDPEVREAFFAAGYGAREYLEVVVGVTMKTLSNYVNHAANTPLDAAFQTAKWAA